MPRRKQPRRTDMKDIRSILRLTHESGLSVREVSERLGLSKSTVSTYLLRAREAGLDGWPMPEGCGDDAALERRLFRQMGRPPRDTTEPDWQLISREMKRKSVTLLLLWQEYREAHPDGFGYTWFCDKFGAHEKRAKAHQRYADRTPASLIERAARMGTNVQILEALRPP